MKKLIKLPIIVSIVMLFLALCPDLPYGYYKLLRLIVCPTAIYLAIFASEHKKTKWVWGMGFIALLFNPVFSIHFYKLTWSFIDLVCGILFIIALFNLKVKPNVD